MHSDGELGEVLEVPAGISLNPASGRTVAEHEHYIRMQGKKLYPFAVRSMRDAIRRCVEIAGWGAGALDLFIPHQANLRIIEAVREGLGMPEEKVCVNIERYGNTSSASIPIALDECVRGGRLKPGDKLGLAAFGGGATWGASVMTWTVPLERVRRAVDREAATGRAPAAREAKARRAVGEIGRAHV